MLAVCKGGVAVDIYVKFSDHFFSPTNVLKSGRGPGGMQFVLEPIFYMSNKLFQKSCLLEALIFY